MIVKARCLSISNPTGVTSEYSDLPGTTGTLRLDEKSNDYIVNYFTGGNGVQFRRKQVTKTKSGLVTVKTHLDNTFVFRIIPDENKKQQTRDERIEADAEWANSQMTVGEEQDFGA